MSTYRAKLHALVEPFELGGPGSGNFGHGGRPGEVGGSSADGPGRLAVRLPDRPSTYFARDADTVMLPLADVVSPRFVDPTELQASKARAVAHMEQTARGEAPRRVPLLVTPTADGRFEILDGHATAALVRAAGWKQVPVHVETAVVLPGATTVTVNGRAIAITRSERASKNGDVLVPVDMQAFDREWAKDTGFHIDPSGTGQIGRRRAGVQRHLATGTEVDAAEVTVQEDGRVSVKDGRHRMAVLRDAGVARVPVAMTTESLANAKKHGLVSRPEPQAPAQDNPKTDLREQLLAVIARALNEFDLGGAGSGNFGHAGRPGEVGGSGPGEGFEDLPQRFHDARRFKGNEGYEWHERPEMEAYAKALPADGVDAVNSYASFSYGDINRLLRGAYVPEMINEFVREATPDEIAQYKDQWLKNKPTEYDPDDPTNKVEDGRIVKNAFTVDPKTGEKVFMSIQRAVPDTARMREIEQKADKIDTLIREHGYALPEAISVNRAAYVPGLSYDDLKAMEGGTIEEKGFTSTMVGNPGSRLDGYVQAGKSESLYKRFGERDSSAIYTHQDEVGAPMRIEIVLPQGTKVAPVETLRRIDHEYPKVQDPEVFKHPEWLTNADGTPNGLKTSDYTIRDRTATPTVKTDRLHDKTQRSEAEILLGSGAQFRVISVRRGDKRIVPSDDKFKPIDVIDVKLEYIGGGSSEPTTSLADAYEDRTDLGGEGSGNFGHAGRPGEVGGSASEGGERTGDTHPHITEKYEAFHALLKAGDEAEAAIDVRRDALNDAWKRWAAEIQDRKKPLKPDGAAAKKLDSYKEAKALEEQFHAQYESTMGRQRALTAQAKEMLKVPQAERSSVVFDDSVTHPLHPGVAASCKRALGVMRQFDGSGAFVPTKFPKEMVAGFRNIFGDDSPLTANADGSFSIPAKLRLYKAESGRSSAGLDGVRIAGGRDLDGSVWHEVAHHIEMKSPAVLRAAVAFRESLADQPHEVYKLNTVNPSLGSDEVALKGKFPDPYSGKLYPQDVATEIVSTGVHAYIADPVSFARDRPEHFKFIFDVLHGKYREAS